MTMDSAYDEEAASAVEGVNANSQNVKGLLGHAVCGSMARATAACLLIPMDTIKTRLQFQQGNSSVRRYAGVRDCARSILREEGIGAFYRGLPPRLLYIGPAAGISFAVYEAIKLEIAGRHDGEHVSAQPFIAGALSRVVGSAVKIPFDVAKQRLEVQGSILSKTDKTHYKGTWDAFQKIYRYDGFIGMWRGLGISLCRDVPFAALYFSTYETVKRVQARAFTKEGKTGVAHHLLSGAVAGVVASAVTIPIDAVRTKIQTDSLNSHEDALLKYRKVVSGPKQSSARDVVILIYREEGIRGFYSGLPPRLASIIPSASITFAAYEFYKRHLVAWMEG